MECANDNKIPQKIKQKYQWCQQTYPQGVLLLEIPKISPQSQIEPDFLHHH